MEKKNILIGITGGIAAYKVCDLINILRKNKYNVKVIMTEAAEEFINPVTLQTLTNNPVYKEMFKVVSPTEVEHIALAQWCDIMLVAPATANTIGKISNGIADNLLTTVIMALPKEKTLIIAPAMNTNMWNNGVVKKNIENLSKIINCIIIKPKVGRLACGDYGEGPLAEIEEIFNAINKYV